MPSDATLTFLLLGLTIALFVSDRLRLDVVALMSLLTLTVSGLVPLEAALAGFSNPAVLMIAGLFVVGAALADTGIADWLGRRIERIAGQSEARVVAVTMLASALLSAFMSSTGTVAILLPVVGTLAKRRGIAPGRLLMPLAFAAHLGSNLLLISTPPNILVSDALRGAGRAPFHFFSFSLPGLALLVVGVAYLATFGRRALASAGGTKEAEPTARLSLAALAAEYGLATSLRALRIAPASALVGRTLGEAHLRSRHGVTVVAIGRTNFRGSFEALRVIPRTALGAGYELRVLGSGSGIAEVVAEYALEPVASPHTFSLPPEETIAEVVIPRRSQLVGRTLRDGRFRDRYRATALALVRGKGKVREVHTAQSLRDLPLEAGDTLLVKGRSRYMQNLRDERSDLVLLAEPDAGSDAMVEPGRALLALGITVSMLLVMALGWLPHVVAVLLAALLLVVTGCVRAADVYRAVNWESVVLIACMIPVAVALERTGGTALIVGALEGMLQGASPRVVLALLITVTSAMGMVLSNTATAVLLAPVALRLATALGLAPEPLLMAVAFGASAAFATPIASPVNVLVMGPGGYRFGAFVRVGLPLQLLVLATAVLVIPLVLGF